MKKYLFTVLSILLLQLLAFAQADQNPCSKIQVAEPANAVNPGEVLSFTLSVPKEINIDGLKFVWSVNQGTIVEGQGSTELKVSTEGLLATTVTASVRISNLPKNCVNDLSGSGLVAYIPHGQPKDEFGVLKPKHLRERIKVFFVDIKDEPGSTGFVIIYGKAASRKMRANEISELIRALKMDEARIEFIDGGDAEKLRTRLWRVPAGVDPSYIY